MSEESTTLECRQCGTGTAEPEAAKVIVVTEAPAGERGPVERRYLADGFSGDTSGLDVIRDGHVIAAYPGEHSWLSVREDGASTGDPYFRQGKKLAIALDALRQIDQDGDNYSARATAEEALADIAELDL